MMRWVVVVIALSVAAACGGSGGFGVGSGGAPADGGTGDAGVSGLVAISLSQTDVHIPVGTMTAFAVTGTYADGTRADLTPQAEARSANPNVAAVAKGPGSQIQIFAVGPGTTNVTVSVGSLQQICVVTVTPR